MTGSDTVKCAIMSVVEYKNPRRCGNSPGVGTPTQEVGMHHQSTTVAMSLEPVALLSRGSFCVPIFS
jgi:hypothetical protein